MTILDRPTDAVGSGDGAGLEAVARGFVPRIRDLARQMEQARRLDEGLVEDLESAGLFSVVVPKRWGGAGLGPHELNKVVEIIANADVSTAWITGFYNFHNWFLCHFPMEVQEELFADRASVRSAAILGPPGSAERVDGGVRVNGRWGYASGMLHASHALVPVNLDGGVHWVVLDRDQLEIVDDWEMAAMCATGSVSIIATDAFVAANRAMPFQKIMSATDHDGTVHEEEVMRLPFSALTYATASIYVGALDAGVEMARERLHLASGADRQARIERPGPRARWVNAYQTARIMHLVRDAATDEAIEIARAGRPHTLEEESRAQLHVLTLRFTVKDTLRDLVDGNGSSGYKADNHLRRMSSDIAMIATHAAHGEYDVMLDRYARWLLGMGLAPGDPGTRMT